MLSDRDIDVETAGMLLNELLECSSSEYAESEEWRNGYEFAIGDAMNVVAKFFNVRSDGDDE